MEHNRYEWGVRWLNDLGRDLRHATQSLRRSPGFSANVALMLALGLGADAAAARRPRYGTRRCSHARRLLAPLLLMSIHRQRYSMHDVDLDGCADLVMAWTTAPLRTESPLVYRNNGSDRFEAISPEPFAGADRRPAARPKRWDREYLRHQRIASPAVARHQLLSLD